MNITDAMTPEAANEPDSGIVKAAMHGMGQLGTIAMWSGQGSESTPEQFSRAATESLLKGETFYTWQRGIPELRQALARYHERHFGSDFSPCVAKTYSWNCPPRKGWMRLRL